MRIYLTPSRIVLVAKPKVFYRASALRFLNFDLA